MGYIPKISYFNVSLEWLFGQMPFDCTNFVCNDQLCKVMSGNYFVPRHSPAPTNYLCCATDKAAVGTIYDVYGIKVENLRILTSKNIVISYFHNKTHFLKSNYYFNFMVYQGGKFLLCIFIELWLISSNLLVIKLFHK